VIGRQDGRAAAFPSVLAQICSGAASEHDDGGDHALARGAQSSDRRTRLSPGKPRSDPISRTSFVLRKKSSSKRTAARTKRRMRRSRTPTGMHGFDARDFVFFDFQTSSSSADCRSSSNAFVQRCSRHELLFQEALKVADWDVERRDASMKGGGDVRAIELRFTHRATPHPALRATFPSKAGEG
jgi:hypothetical protein